jgi:mono/diheme cytochrome c family protein
LAAKRWWLIPAILAALALAAVIIFVASSMLQPPTPQQGAQVQSAGALLYDQNCASCHGSLANSAKRGRTAVQIQNAIISIPSMNYLSNLNATQIQQIATALSTP